MKRSLRRKFQGEENPDTLAVMSDLASTCEYEGRFGRRCRARAACCAFLQTIKPMTCRRPAGSDPYAIGGGKRLFPAQGTFDPSRARHLMRSRLSASPRFRRSRLPMRRRPMKRSGRDSQPRGLFSDCGDIPEMLSEPRSDSGEIVQNESVPALKMPSTPLWRINRRGKARLVSGRRPRRQRFVKRRPFKIAMDIQEQLGIFSEHELFFAFRSNMIPSRM